MGRYGNADGFLVYADALERSCNVWPETVADRLGWERLEKWYRQFGLGRSTGLGIAETSGRLPKVNEGPAQERRSRTWFAAIGQGIGATPIQMANVAATIARDGVWLRPTLIAEGYEEQGGAEKRVVLPLDKSAVAAAREGMTAVVNAAGGTGTKLRRQDMVIAGKTGTAQAQKFSVVMRDEKGEPIKVGGVTQRRILEPSVPGRRNEEAPWYRGGGADGTDLDHAWYMGFAPAQRPQVAFAVMVEYGGGSGGSVAGGSRSPYLLRRLKKDTLRFGGKRHMSETPMPGPEQLETLALPPRPLGTKAKLRLLNEPIVRFWCVVSVLIGLTFVFVTVQAVSQYFREARLIESGPVVDAIGWAPGGAKIKGRPLPVGQTILVEYEYQGKKYSGSGPLTRTGLEYHAGEPFQIRLDADDPSMWTNRKDPASLREKLVGSIVTAFFLVICVVTALIWRMLYARLWRDGDLHSAKVLEHRQNALAPHSVGLYCAVKENRQEHRVTVYVPQKRSVPEVGQTLAVLTNPGATRAIAVMNYSS